MISRDAADGEGVADNPWGARAVLQFFVGGAVLFVTALSLIFSSVSDYDTVFSLLVLGVFAVVVAAVSMVGAFVVGLPLRLIAGLRSRWLANGELTVVGAVVGLSACCLLIAFAPVTDVTAELGTSPSREPIGWALFAAWALFALSVAHFAWPRRWRRS
ncbi:hypothetical protein ITJ43_10210 [Microbacterium sp. VKM Ac-2870]|uniref:hypothetical protein n=1 Tax=Microbacterium sp. VKM Ac-2870 TaxID=2783825 RepID=UPI00188A4491|nr:hypothetical protein [Microbacterium sp. VKM Ac-2870]MBF4562517.1 hypothetical protein [Microbacterium sp. VKM Ac-2870]